MKNKSEKIKDAGEKLQEKAEEFINKLHTGDTTKGYIDYVKELETLESFPLQQVICKNLLKRKQSYTKFHFRKQDLRHYVYTTEHIATFLEDKGNKSLAKQIRQEKNDWLSKGLWSWRKNHINKDGKMLTKKKAIIKKKKTTVKQQKRSSKSNPITLLTQQGKPLTRNGKDVQAIITPDGQIKILGSI